MSSFAIQSSVMPRFCSIWLCLLALIFSAQAGTYSLENGQSVSGDPISFNETGVVLKAGDGAVQPRTPYTAFSQAALKQLHAEAFKKNKSDAKQLEPFITEIVEQQAKRREIRVEIPPRVTLPEGKTGLGSMFSSPVGIFICLVLYAANLLAAREIALFKNKPVGVVCGAAAVLPLIGPAIFLAIPGIPEPEEVTSSARAESTGAPASPGTETYSPSQPIAPPPADGPLSKTSQLKNKITQAFGGAEPAGAEPEPVAEVNLPEPQIFNRAQFTFNRRFFETKLPGFFRVVPTENEKDLLIEVKSNRGEFVGRRIPRITQGELFLQVFKGEATADEMIPFTEIQEVQIRHKDWK